MWSSIAIYCFIACTTLSHSLSLKPTVTTSGLIKPIVKVPSSAWRWPNAWPFSEDSFEMVPNPLADPEAASTSAFSSFSLKPNTPPETKFLSWNSDLYAEYLQSFDNYAKEQKLLITTKEQQQRGQSMALDWTTCTLDELTSVVKQRQGRPYQVIVIDGHLGTLSNPLMLFKDVWKLLASEGICQILIEEHPSMPVKEYVKIWKTSTAEQKLWIAGSYLNYAIDQGWESIEAVDITGSTGSEMMKFSFDTDSQHHFVINAKKVLLPSITTSLNSTEIVNALNKRMATLNYVTSTERSFISKRLYAMSTKVSTSPILDDSWINQNVFKVEEIYSVLKDVKPNVIPPPARALLSTLLLSQWKGTEEQMNTLREAVGLLTTTNPFWKDLAAQTAKLTPKDKLYLLAEVVGAGLNSDSINNLPKLIGDLSAKLSQKQQIEEGLAITTATKLAISSIKQSVAKIEQQLQQI